MKLIKEKKNALIATNILAKTYAKAPNITWILEGSKRKLQYFFSIIVEDAIIKKGAYLTSNNKGVLLLYNLKNKNSSIATIFKKLFLILFVLGIKKSAQVNRLRKLHKSIRPKIGLYGMALAIDDDQNKWQTSIEIKKEVLAIQKHFNLPVYAETTNPRFVQLYEKIGFVTYKKMLHPYADLDIWFMKMGSENI